MFEEKRYVNHENKSIIKLIPVDSFRDIHSYQPFPGQLPFVPDLKPLVDFVFILPVEIPIPVPNMYGIPSINLVEVKIPILKTEADTLEKAFEIHEKKSKEVEAKLIEEIEKQVQSQKNKVVTPQDLTKGAASKLQIVR